MAMIIKLSTVVGLASALQPSLTAAPRPKTALAARADVDRLAVLKGAAAAVAAPAALGALGIPLPAAAAETDYKAIAGAIADIIKADPAKGPTFLRLAWRAAGERAGRPAFCRRPVAP